ncbi:MAG: hypothetical protein ACOX62_04520 [Christensenellales bacterium]
MTQKNTRVRFIALQLMLMIVLQPFSALAGLSTPWFSYRLGGSSIAYPAGMKAPSDPLVVGFWVMAEPVDPLEYFEGHSNQYYFSAFQGGKYKAVLQHRLMLHDNGLGEYWVFQNVIGYKEAYPKALDAIGYKTDRGRLSIVFVTGSGTQSFFARSSGWKIVKNANNTAVINIRLQIRA